MAITETRQLPAKFIEDLGVDLGKQIVAQSGVPVVAPGAGGITQLAENQLQILQQDKKLDNNLILDNKV